MKRRLTQVVGSVFLTGTVLFGASTIQAQNWTFTDVSPQVKWMSDEELRGYREGLMKGVEAARANSKAEPKEFDQYRNGGSAYKYGFRRGFYESRYGYRKVSLE
jgi:hypothetical protein